MPEATDYARLRRDVGATEAQLSDEQAQALFVEAEELYTGPDSIRAGTRVLALQGMLASAADEVNYTQNNATENLSDRFKHLESLLKLWQQRLDVALDQETEELEGLRPPTSHGVTLRRRW